MSATTTQFVEGQFMKPAEVMKLFGYTNRASFWQFVRRAGVPFVSFGLRTKRFEASALRAYIDTKAVGNGRRRGHVEGGE